MTLIGSDGGDIHAAQRVIDMSRARPDRDPVQPALCIVDRQVEVLGIERYVTEPCRTLRAHGARGAGAVDRNRVIAPTRPDGDARLRRRNAIGLNQPPLSS